MTRKSLINTPKTLVYWVTSIGHRVKFEAYAQLSTGVRLAGPEAIALFSASGVEPSFQKETTE
jgi:hypothetical protein